MKIIELIKWNEQGLVPAIIQDTLTNKILMMAWMNEDALVKTIETKQCYFFSRSRNKLWLKGEDSGHVHLVDSVQADCDYDTLLIKVNVENKISCHTGRNSCFYNQVTDDGDTIIVIEEIIKDPKEIYKK
jgi:phosphoribosyl-AMP cyclohydrolase